MTSGGPPARVTGFLQRYRTVLTLLYGMGALICAVNVGTASDDLAEAGARVQGWEIWCWEISSLLAWALLMPGIGALTLALGSRPPAQRLLAGLVATLPLSGLHIGGMVAMRHLTYALVDARYRFDWSAANLLYEWRKDVVTITIVVVAFLIAERLRAGEMATAPAATTPTTTPATPAEPARIEVRDQGRTWWLAPEEIAWAAAAGNYVELHTPHGALLHRVTLAALAETLGPHGFVRIHRSRLVRRAAIRAVAATPSGDFEVELTDGTRLAGSRRYPL